jgi:hypothetical protein
VVAVAFQIAFYLEIYQNNIFCLFLKNYFWYQLIKMIWKQKKYINFKQRKKINFFKSAFETQKQTEFYKTQLKKHIKTAFQTQFFNGSRSTKYSLVCYQTSFCVCFTTNIKVGEKQSQP